MILFEALRAISLVFIGVAGWAAVGFVAPLVLGHGNPNGALLFLVPPLLFALKGFVVLEPGDAPEWAGAKGFVHEAAKTHFGNDFRGHKAYLCGPPLMIDACITTLMQGRLFERDIYTEKFISAADTQQVRSPLFKAI